VDAILGAARQLHTVIPSWCTGCELCLASCPVDCIHMREWPQGLAEPSPADNRARYLAHEARQAAAIAARNLELTLLKQDASFSDSAEP
jgi:electron transport complex protein RnfB